MHRRYALLLLATTIAGCVSMGTNYDPVAVTALTPGMDKAEVIARLGKPTSSSTMADGRQQLMWIYSRGTALGTAKSRSATLIFGADGKYIGLFNQTEVDLR
ncbi:MAG TPA: outer membrane protein assembly factor BamE [Novosphingobium sp.]|nr:outer membrane protein assembly factor BamE [Novosphingobium sp.]